MPVTNCQQITANVCPAAEAQRSETDRKVEKWL